MKSVELLRDVNKLNRTILQASIDGVMLNDGEGHILYVNEAYCQMSGYSEQELLAMRIIDVEAQETAPEILSHIEKVTTHGSDRFKSFHRRKDGTFFPVDICVRYVNSDANYYVAYIRDESHQDTSAGKMLGERWRLQSIIQGARVGTWEWNIQTGQVALNDTWAEIVGYSLSELVPINIKTWEFLAHPDDLKKSNELLQQHFAGKIPYYDCECRMRHKDGHWVWIHDRGRVIVRTQDGNPLMMFGTHTDITDRKRAEAALLESEEKFRLIAETIDEAFWMSDVEIGKTDYVSPSFERIWGRSRESLYTNPRSFLDAVHPEDRERFLSELERKKKGLPFNCEYRIFLPDGRTRHIWDRGFPLRDEHGRVAKYVGVASDITERKKAQEAIGHSHDLMRYIIEHSRSAIAVHDRDLRYIYVSQRYLDEYMVKERDVIGKHHYEVFPDLPQKWRDVHQRVLHGEVLSAEDDPYTREDGSTDWTRWECRPWYEADGSIGGIIVYTEVITERKLAEEKLRDSEERNRRLIEASADAILVHSKNVVNYANPAARRLFRANRREELIGKLYSDMIYSEDRKKSVVGLHGDNENGHIPLLREHRILTSDGQVIQVESTEVPFQHRGETQVFGVFRDISERKQIESEKIKLEMQLRQAQKMEAIGTLAGGIAHDFNNLLGVIMGNADILNMIDIPEIKENVIPILSASKRAKQLVKQILTFSRQGEQQKMLISLKPIVKETIGFLRASLPSTIQLQHHISPEVGTIIADPTQMQQILMNLCTNAGHAMEETGGTLTISLQNIEFSSKDTLSPPIRIGQYVLLKVSDTGAGISPLIRDRIFDPYYTTKKPGKGTGLGLSVVHGIVSSHAGAISVDSEEGKGTTFYVYLPQAQNSVEPSIESTQTLQRGDENILLVDDEPALADIGNRMLSLLGYHVEQRTSSIEALELFKSNPNGFDAVITDMTMPNLTGLNLAKQILEIRSNMPILLCTGFSDQVDSSVAGSLGIGAVLLKPLVISEIGPQLRRVIDNAK